MSRQRLPLIAAACLLAATPARADLPPLIPRQVLFGSPDYVSPQISPDGKRLAYLAPNKGGVFQVWVRTVGRDDARPVTAEKKRGIPAHLWTYAPDTLLYLKDDDGDQNLHVYSVQLRDRVVRDLTPFQGVSARQLALHRDFPNELLVGLNVKDRRVHDVYRIDLTTGAVVLDTPNPGDVASWQVDPRFRVAVTQSPLPDGGTEVRYRPDDKSPWQTVVRWGVDDAEGRVLGFSADGRSLWLASSAGRDTLALVRRSLATGQEKVLASDGRVDVSAVIFNPRTHEVEAVAFNRERVRWQTRDPLMAADLRVLEGRAPGEPSLVSGGGDLKTWVVAYSSDVAPTAYYLYERPAQRLTKLSLAQPALAPYRLAPMKPRAVKSRDGLELVCYLTLPVGVAPRRLPMVLLVHGGPWARDSWGYNPEAQWLANRGYAVLSVNYRGSTGFGKKFLHAGDREWGGKMHDDLIDAVRWAVREGYADARRVAIYGGSYGGYAALVGAAFTPDVFACAVDVVGPSNLVTLLRSLPPSWGPRMKMFAVRVGDVEKEEEFLRSRSPLFKADKIQIPLLIAQGAKDVRVKPAESEQIVAALRKAGKPVEYLLFPDEGHGFARPENRLKFHAAAEAFLAKHLGGRVEPAGAAPPSR
jgi:dipeptidyl aminopeptidase/acylaminoacyl peptidase